MSRIGKKPIIIPAGVEVTIEGTNVQGKGPRVRLSRTFGSDVLIAKENDVLIGAPAKTKAKQRARCGERSGCIWPIWFRE